VPARNTVKFKVGRLMKMAVETADDGVPASETTAIEV